MRAWVVRTLGCWLATALLAAPGARGALPGGGDGADRFALMVSDAPSRTGPRLLDGAELSGTVYVFLAPPHPRSAIGHVHFRLDGMLLKTELQPPYDLLGSERDGRTAAPLDTHLLEDGLHRLSAQIVFASGGQRLVDARFEVRNARASTGRVDRRAVTAVGETGRGAIARSPLRYTRRPPRDRRARS